MVKKDQAFRCKCGVMVENEDKLIKHCNKDHVDNPFILFDIIGVVGSIEAGSVLVRQLLGEKLRLQSELDSTKKELERQANEVVKGNNNIERLVSSLNIIDAAVCLPKDKHDDMMVIISNTFRLLKLFVKNEQSINANKPK